MVLFRHFRACGIEEWYMVKAPRCQGLTRMDVIEGELAIVGSVADGAKQRRVKRAAGHRLCFPIGGSTLMRRNLSSTVACAYRLNTEIIRLDPACLRLAGLLGGGRLFVVSVGNHVLQRV